MCVCVCVYMYVYKVLRLDYPTVHWNLPQKVQPGNNISPWLLLADINSGKF